MNLRYIILSATILFICGQQSSGSNVELFPMAPALSFDSRVSVSINGNKVKADYFKNFHKKDHIHFFESTRVRLASDGAIDVKVDIDLPLIPSAVLRSVGKDFNVKISGSSLKFTLQGPGNYYLQLPCLAKPEGTYTILFFIDDLAHIKAQGEMLSREKYQNIREFDIISDENLDQTEKIQQVLSRGGNILFPKGIYRTGNLKILSNTSVFLARGAMIKGTNNYHLKGASAFFDIENAENVKVFGQGIIDVNGMAAFDSVANSKTHGFDIAGSRNIYFEDFLIQGSNSWCIHIKYSKFFTADNLKVFSGKDGFDPDASQDVIIKNSSIQSLDDAFAVKNRYPEKSTTERVLMKNCIVTSVKSSLKVGTESKGLIRDVTWEDMDVYDCERGIVLYASDGGPVENITWRNVRMYMIDWVHEKLSGTAFHLYIRMREKPTPVKNCLIENVQTNFIYTSQFEGLPDAPLDGVRMKNISITADTPKKNNCTLFEFTKNVSIIIDGLHINWKNNKNQWTGLISGDGLKIIN